MSKRRMKDNNKTMMYLKAAESLYAGNELDNEEIERLRWVGSELEKVLNFMNFVSSDLAINNDLNSYLQIHIYQIQEACETGIVPNFVTETRKYCQKLGDSYLEQIKTNSAIN